MIEIRGIGEYIRYSGGSDRSKKGGANQGAEFSELVNTDDNRKADVKTLAPEGEEQRLTIESETESAVYDGMGRPLRSGLFAGRLFDVQV